MSFCLFVCLGFFVPLENFSLIWRRHHYRWRVANFGLRWALMAIEQWGFFSVAHLLWHGASVYKCHLRGRVTLTPIDSAALTTCFYDLGLSRLGFEPQTFRLRGERSKRLSHRRGLIWHNILLCKSINLMGFFFYIVTFYISSLHFKLQENQEAHGDIKTKQLWWCKHTG